MNEVLDTKDKTEKAVLVALITYKQNEEQTKEYLRELEFLASTINIVTQTTFTQRLDRPDKRTFVGKGKLEEIKQYIQMTGTETVIFDDELSPSQVRNIEEILEVKVYDRNLLILDIFLFRAQTAQAKTQVELARSQYLLPRLTNMWTHLERQRGGTSTRGGSGEKEIETDRRDVRDKISKLKKQLQKIDVQSITQRKSRGDMVRVALVGYTNVGKSTIMNILSKAEVFAENKLFATVDSTVRKVVINNVPFLLTDTVGFIRKLPHSLIECFKSTLDEVREADILLHVVDISHPNYEDQMEIVKKTLVEINANDKLVITVYNKVDQFVFETEELEEEYSDEVEVIEKIDLSTLTTEEKLDRFEKSYINSDDVVFLSAFNNLNIEKLRRETFEKVTDVFYTIYPNYVKPKYYS